MGSLAVYFLGGLSVYMIRLDYHKWYNWEVIKDLVRRSSTDSLSYSSVLEELPMANKFKIE